MSTWYGAANKALSENSLIECADIITYAAKEEPESLLISSSTLKLLKLKLYSNDYIKSSDTFFYVDKKIKELEALRAIERKDISGNNEVTKQYMNFVNREAGNIERLCELDELIERKTGCQGNKLSMYSLAALSNFIRDKSIALVANSSLLMRRKQGEQIDRNDIVIRFNSFSISREHTGERTDIHACIYLNDHNQNIFVPMRVVVSSHLGRWAKKVENMNPYNQSSIIQYNHHSICNSKLYTDPRPPTTGFVIFTMLMILKTFKEVNLYGFSFYEGGKSDIMRSNEGILEGISNIHDYSFEQTILKRIAWHNKEENIYSIKR